MFKLFVENRQLEMNSVLNSYTYETLWFWYGFKGNRLGISTFHHKYMERAESEELADLLAI